MSFSKLVPILILAAIMVLGASFMPQILGSVEAGQDDSISQAYKDQVNSTRDVSIVTITTTKFFAPILGVLGLVIAVMWLSKASRKW